MAGISGSYQVIQFTPVQINNKNKQILKKETVKLATSVCLLYRNPPF